MSSLFCPAALVDLAERTVRSYINAASWGERQIFALIRSGMQIPDPTPTEQAALNGDSGEHPQKQTDGLDARMHELLERAVEQNTTSGRQALFHKILDQLVPDEARIISALSDGSETPMVNVYARTRKGLFGEATLENMSLIGKTASLALPHLTPMYVSHLLSLGLLESGPEDSKLKDEYEILSADTQVLGAVKAASRGPLPAQVEKCTLRLSELGHQLWAAATGTPEPK